jgi:hypothetical protein
MFFGSYGSFYIQNTAPCKFVTKIYYERLSPKIEKRRRRLKVREKRVEFVADECKIAANAREIGSDKRATDKNG